MYIVTAKVTFVDGTTHSGIVTGGNAGSAIAVQAPNEEPVWCAFIVVDRIDFHV
jgi:hypothetical protein